MENLVIEWSDSSEECNSTITVCLVYESVDKFAFDLEEAAINYIDNHKINAPIYRKWQNKGSEIFSKINKTHNPKKKSELEELLKEHEAKEPINPWENNHVVLGGVEFNLSEFVSVNYYPPSIKTLQKWFDDKWETDQKKW